MWYSHQFVNNKKIGLILELLSRLVSVTNLPYYPSESVRRKIARGLIRSFSLSFSIAFQHITLTLHFTYIIWSHCKLGLHPWKTLKEP